LLISPLNAFPWVINGLVEAHVSIKRVQRFINTEPTYLDEYYENTPIDLQLSLGISFASSSSPALFN
jgi:ATP-binding cassette subfamily C (CFTR/MRP) protein 10